MTVRKRSWFEITQTPAWGFSLGGLWLVIAVLQWVALVGDDDYGARSIIFGVVATLAAILYLGHAFVRLRQNRLGPR